MEDAIDFAREQCDFLLAALWGYPPKPEESSPPNKAAFIMVGLALVSAIYRWGKIESTSESIFDDLENCFVEGVDVMQSVGVDCFRKWKDDIKDRLMWEGFESHKVCSRRDPPFLENERAVTISLFKNKAHEP